MRFIIVPVLYLVLAVGVAAADFNHTASDMECGTTGEQTFVQTDFIWLSDDCRGHKSC
jgi:hypothetical protein